MRPTPFETRVLAENDLAVFQDRLIYQARPPVTKEDLARLQERCCGPLPKALLSLWKVSFGGYLDYKLEVLLENHKVDLAFTELFYPGADAYHDLWGWIEFEQELAGPGPLAFLPIGGFEYCDRVYVQVIEGEGHGQVLAWKQGYPLVSDPERRADRAGVIAPDVCELFDRLELPQTPSPRGGPGTEALQAIARIPGKDPATKALRRKLQAMVLATVNPDRAPDE